jgi:hypothetical protein
MRKGWLSWSRWTVPALIALSLCGTGCKSGWKMPGTGMWPWGRQPSASTLAADTTSPKLTEGPAANHNPVAVASAAAGTKPSAPTSLASTATPGAGMAGAGTLGAQNLPTVGGTAAAANGYQIGPYGMAGAGGTRSASGMPSASSQAAAPNPLAPNPLAPNPAAPNQAAPNQVTPFGGSIAQTGYPNQLYTGTAGLPNSSPAPFGSLATTPALPPATPHAGLGSLASTPMPNMPMPGLPQSGLPQSGLPQSGLPGAPLQSGTAQGYSMPVAQQAGSLAMPSVQPTLPGAPAASWPSPTAPQFPASNVTTASATGDVYRPGTTSRTTNYNFGGSPATSPTSGFGASGYGSFQLPPNTASGSGPGVTVPLPQSQPTLYR